jgi:hypothetical protein
MNRTGWREVIRQMALLFAFLFIAANPALGLLVVPAQSIGDEE